MSEACDERRIGATLLRLSVGTIVGAGTEAIVNAANSRLTGGGGVDGAIHSAAGPELYQLTAVFGGCPIGSAVITPVPRAWPGAGWIPPRTRFIIHAVGPAYDPQHEDRGAVLLAGAYRTSLGLAAQHGLKSVALPSISTGAHGYPIEKAAPIALGTTEAFLRERETSIEEIVFVLFSERNRAVYRATLTNVR
jgi:serine/threonine-protein kinase